MPFLAATLAAACAPPPGSPDAVSEAARTAPPPELIETARFDAALAGAAPDAERLGAGAAALSDRATGLRARAAALAGPVLPDDDRTRLEAAAADPPTVGPE